MMSAQAVLLPLGNTMRDTIGQTTRRRQGTRGTPGVASPLSR